MAKKHKAPTQVTLVQEEKGAFAQWIDTNWKMLAVVAVAATGVILGSQILSSRSAAEEDSKFDTLRSAVVSTDPGVLASAAAELAGTGLEGWANLMAVELAAVEGRYSDAQASLADLERTAPDLLTKLPLPIGPDGEPRSLLEHVKATVASQAAQEGELGLLLNCPDAPEGSPVVRFETSEGIIEIALFEEAAPLHVANMLDLISKKHYDNTRFHRVLKGFMIQGGDPNTKDASSNRSSWGQGGAEIPKIEPEAENGLVHGPFVLAAAKMPGDDQSSGTQFYITAGHTHHLDGLHTVYGKVISGEDVVRKLAAVPVQMTAQSEYSAPIEAPELVRATLVSGG